MHIIYIILFILFIFYKHRQNIHFSGTSLVTIKDVHYRKRLSLPSKNSLSISREKASIHLSMYKNIPSFSVMLLIQI